MCNRLVQRYRGAPRGTLATLHQYAAFRSIVRCWMLDAPDDRAFWTVASYAGLGMTTIVQQGAVTVPVRLLYSRSESKRRTQRFRELLGTTRRLRASLVRNDIPVRRAAWAAAMMRRMRERDAGRLLGRRGPSSPATATLRALWPRLHIDPARFGNPAYMRDPSVVASSLLCALGVEISPSNAMRTIRAMLPPRINLWRPARPGLLPSLQ